MSARKKATSSSELLCFEVISRYGCSVWGDNIFEETKYMRAGINPRNAAPHKSRRKYVDTAPLIREQGVT